MEDNRDALARIAGDLFLPSWEVSEAAANAMARILASLRADDLPYAEDVIRAAWRGRHRGPVSREMLALLSFHPNGFEREAAVKRLATMSDGSELGFLLLRLNDWVPQVRAAARDAIRARIRVEYADAFARNFFLVDRLEHLHRAKGESLLEPLARMYAQAGTAALLDALERGSRRTRRAIIRFVIDSVPNAWMMILPVCASADDDLLRRWITPLAPRALPAGEALAMLQRLGSDPTPSVRREAIAALARAFPAEAEREIQRGWLDPSASVRETARHLASSSHTDFGSIYRDAIDTAPTPQKLASAIAGLGEVGAAIDADRVARHLTYPSPSVRRAALQCVMRLSGETYADRVASMLLDSSPAVSAAARRALRNHAATLGRRRIEEIFATAETPHARRNAIRLFAALPKWQSITCLLAAAKTDEAVADMTREFIRRWNLQYNRTATPPSKRELDELVAALAAAGPAIDSTTASEVRFALKAFL